MNERTRAKALSTLENMRTIVLRDRLKHGEYATVVDGKDDPAAICQGRKFCAIGALNAGYGIRAKDCMYGTASIDGTGDDAERRAFRRNRPGLRIAANALNEAAQRVIESGRYRRASRWFQGDMDRLEDLFEGFAGVGRTEILRVIAAAKRTVKAAA